jgi:hypothetical protein
MNSQYTDLKIYREYFRGAIKTRQMLCGFDVVQHLRTHHPGEFIATMLIHKPVSQQIFLTQNFHESAPVWKLEKIRTQVKLLNKIRFFLPGWLDDLLLQCGVRDHWAEVDQLGNLILEERLKALADAEASHPSGQGRS